MQNLAKYVLLQQAPASLAVQHKLMQVSISTCHNTPVIERLSIKIEVLHWFLKDRH